MQRSNAWRRQADRYFAKSDAAPDPVLREQYSALAELCQDLAAAHRSLFVGKVLIAFNVGYATPPMPAFLGDASTRH